MSSKINFATAENPYSARNHERANHARKPVRARVGGKTLARAYWVSTFLLAAAFLSALVAVCAGSDTSLPEAWLLLFATVSTLAAPRPATAGASVLLAALITALIGGGAHILGVKSGFLGRCSARKPD